MRNLKKKVALLLALVMMLSLVPTNVFGATTLRPGPGVPADQAQERAQTFLDINLPDLIGGQGWGNSIFLNLALNNVGPNYRNNFNAPGAAFDADPAGLTRFPVGTSALLVAPVPPAPDSTVNFPVGVDMPGPLGGRFWVEAQFTGWRNAVMELRFVPNVIPAGVTLGGQLVTLLPVSIQAAPNSIHRADGTITGITGIPVGTVFSTSPGAMWNPYVERIPETNPQYIVVTAPAGPMDIVTPGGVPITVTVPAGSDVALPAGVTLSAGTVIGASVPSNAFAITTFAQAGALRGPVPSGTTGHLTLPLPTINVDSGDLTLTVTRNLFEGDNRVILPGRVVLPQLVAPHQMGVTIDSQGVRNFGDLWNVVTLDGINITENRRGSFAQPGGSMTLRFIAPEHYTWGSDTPTLHSFGASAVVSGTIADGAWDHNVGNNGRYAELTISDISYLTTIVAANPLNMGRFRVEGLQLIPREIAPITGPLNITVRAAAGGQGSLTTNSARWYAAGMHVANRGVGGLTVTNVSDPIPTLNAGLASGWNSGIIRIATTAPGSFIQDQTVAISIDQPGVSIRGLQWRWANAVDSMPGFGGPTAYRDRYDLDPANNRQVFGGAGQQFAHIFNEGTISRAEFRAGGVASAIQNRNLEFQLHLNIDPDVDFDLIYVRVELNAQHGRVDETVPLALVRNPVTLSVDEVTDIPVYVAPLGLIHPASLGNVTVEENAVGMLQSGRFLYVYVLPTFPDGRVSPWLGLGWGGEFNFLTSLARPEVTGGLRVGPGRLVPRAELPEYFPRIPVYRFMIEQTSTATNGGAGTVTFTDNIIHGGLHHVEGVNFTFVVAGNAVANNVIQPPIGAMGNHRLNIPAAARAYEIVAGSVLGDVPGLALGEEPGDGEEEPGNGDELDILFELPQAGATNIHGLPLFVTENGRDYVNLRGMMEPDRIPGGIVDFIDGVGAIFSAPRAEGGLVVIREIDGEFVVTGVEGVTTGAQLGLRNIDYTWYLPVFNFQTTFGYLIVEDNGYFVFARP